MDQPICLTKGITAKIREKVLKAFKRENLSAHLIPITDAMGPMRVQDLLDTLTRGEESPGGVNLGGDQVVFIATTSQEEGLTLMRLFKGCSPKPRKIAFAIITKTARNWTVEGYIDHVLQEHNYMKGADPRNEPDMMPL